MDLAHTTIFEVNYPIPCILGPTNHNKLSFHSFSLSILEQIVKKFLHKNMFLEKLYTGCEKQYIKKKQGYWIKMDK
jgi:hypothetical protein